MVRVAKLVALVVAIPIAGYLIGTYAQRSAEKRFQVALEKVTIPAVRAKLPDTFAEYCGAAAFDIDRKVSDDCGSRPHIARLKVLSFSALLAGLLLLGAIALAARAAANDRNLLLRLFAPGIRIVLYALFGLILVQGFIASYGFMVLESALIGRVHIFVVLAIGLGALLGSFTMLRAGLSISKRATSTVIGEAVHRKDQPLVWKFVDRLAERLKATPPKNIVVGLDPTFYVTSADVIVRPKGFPHQQSTMYLSLPLMRILTLPELTAVIGHELGHFRGEDTKFSLGFYPVYAGTGRALAALESHSFEGGWQSLALWPGVAVLGFFYEAFAQAESAIGRDRELEADKCGASVANAEAIATSLLKVGAYAPAWGDVQQTIAESIQGKGMCPPNASLAFVQKALSGPVPKVDDVAMEDAIAHPTDSHPPTIDRIRALKVDLTAIRAKALVVDPAASSVKLFVGADQIEERLTEIERQMIADYLQNGGYDEDE
ncbi:M48 family metallopeptidase [Usitatibacter palustris]|uniref:Protease HtpX n=1 Tax=Usitatibacter palustris TaxID=2732487 RepID=A0A6M4H416_9PROT|nr:M48 family metallopeptidase [Usitatibacter palustris]QJR14075.1 Protease HtpX [Usitatibacter palustris]